MTLKEKKYTLLDFIAIPLKNAPLWTSIILLHRLIISFIPSIQVFVTAKFVNTAIDIFNGTQSKENIFPVLFMIIGMIAYQYLSWTLVGIVDMKQSMRLTELFDAAIIQKRAKLSYCHVENNDTWELINRTCSNAVDRILGGFNNVIGAVDMIIRVVSLITIIMTQVWWSALIIIAISIPLFIISLKGGKSNYTANKEAEKHQRRADYLGSVMIDRENVEERTMFSYSDKINNQWLEKYKIAMKINHKTQLKNFIRMKGASLTTVFINIFIVSTLIPSLKTGVLSIGMFMALVQAIFNLVQMMSWQLSWITSELSNSHEYLKDLTEFSQLSEQDCAIDLPKDMSDFQFESIEFKNVSFQYPGTEAYILKNCSFLLNANTHYAFVGINGAGKTTITKLLTGMYDNYDGEIFINQKNIRDYQLSELKGIFSVVYQDFAKYYITLKDNILLGDVLVQDEEKMMDVINTIDLNNAVNKLEHGVDTYLGKIKDNGVDLSGGEWQRLAIARTLYSNSKMFILDEPTAALDPIAESHIYEMFSKVSMNKSAIFITHRLGAAKLADEILVIDNGKIAEQGNHQELTKQGGIYAEMFESQKGWYQE